MTLWAAAIDNGYVCPVWMTFKQAQELGAQVRKGEKGSLVVYANTLHRTDIDERTGEETERDIPYLKGYTVFNSEQIEGLKGEYFPKLAPRLETIQRDEEADKFFAATGAEIRHGGNRAFYASGSDHIQMPTLEAFRDRESYYATLVHEATHWTMHKSRLDRDLGRKKWGDAGICADRQIDGLTAICDELHMEKLSAVSKLRPVYSGIVSELKAGDMLVVWDLDRAYRSAADALNEINALAKRGIGFRIANFPVDTSTPEGYLLLTILSGMSEFERRILSRRTKEGLAAARARGKRLGRPHKLTVGQVELAKQRLASKDVTAAALAKELCVGRSTLGRAIRRSSDS